MQASVVLTVIGPDRPGLVEALSQTVATHDANWVESRMAHLGGQFAGLLRVQVEADRTEALATALAQLEGQGLRVLLEVESDPEPRIDRDPLVLELVGQDRPGIVRDLSRALAARGVNVEELATECGPAPMSGETLFRARLQLRLPPQLAVETLRDELETLANELMVDVEIE